ncbi:uncharacterized protein LOC110735855 [Chenopodium quinoa]|uniref:uncharacterized protein LOC110735855 n=1 Tax=Chenopodium quinoa TaxID=63459 RepID=UPI000B785F6F|nr:uncharacterized protein LOC110735855 [Chenopodium quinoa]
MTICNSQAQEVAQALEVGEILSGSGLNQELSLKRPGDTHWGSHYKCLVNVIRLISTIVKKGARYCKCHGISYFHKKCVAKNEGTRVGDSLLNKVTLFCTKHGIDVLTMDALYVPQGRSRRFVEKATNLHHFRVEIFLGAIDLHLQELDNRFNEKSMELLTCIACLSPKDNFSSFDKEKVLKLASFCFEEFSSFDLMTLEGQLDMFMENMHKDERFQNLRDLNSLSMMLINTKKDKTYPPVYLLFKLMLILPVATTSVERVFSAMTYVKIKLRNSMDDQFMSDYCLVTFIEKEVFLQFPNEEIIDRFQNMKTRRMQL